MTLAAARLVYRKAEGSETSEDMELSIRAVDDGIISEWFESLLSTIRGHILLAFKRST